jgi:hypothetical protein
VPGPDCGQRDTNGSAAARAVRLSRRVGSRADRAAAPGRRA